MEIVCWVFFILLSAFIGTFLIEHTSLKKKLINFDAENKGPVYEFIKNLLFLILILACSSGSIVALLIPDYISKGQFIDAITSASISVLSGILMTIVLSLKKEK